jgi:Fe-S-cluster containining protein
MNQPTEPKMFELDLQTNLGRLRGKMRLPNRPMRAAELAWNLMKVDDQLVQMGVTQSTGPHAGGEQVSCQKGCGACCRQLVPLSPPEAFMIADVVLGLPDERRNAVVDRFVETRAALERAGVQALAGSERPSDEESLQLAFDYFEQGLPCPFLEDESCSIHANRPSACREYLVTSAPTLCASIRHNRVRRVPTPVQLSDYLSQLWAILVGGEPVTIPLPAALGWVEQHWEEGQRHWDAEYLFNTLSGLFQKPLSKAG